LTFVALRFLEAAAIQHLSTPLGHVPRPVGAQPPIKVARQKVRLSSQLWAGPELPGLQSADRWLAIAVVVPDAKINRMTRLGSGVILFFCQAPILCVLYRTCGTEWVREYRFVSWNTFTSAPFFSYMPPVDRGYVSTVTTIPCPTVLTHSDPCVPAIGSTVSDRQISLNTAMWRCYGVVADLLVTSPLPRTSVICVSNYQRIV